MPRIRSHRDLEVYQLAFEAAMKVFEVTKGFPREERYSLTDQTGYQWNNLDKECFSLAPCLPVSVSPCPLVPLSIVSLWLSHDRSSCC